MENIYDQFATDQRAETEGVRLPYGDAGWIQIARAGGSNTAFMRRAEEYTRKYQRKIDQSIMPHDVAREALIEIFADTVILDGELRGRDGTMVPLKGNRDAVIKFMTDLPDLFLDVKEQAEGLSSFKELVTEDNSKN